jgi:excinuclease ABC subunit A
MDFMSDIWLTCDTCNGMRYNEAILTVKLNGKSIGDVLRMTVQEAIEFIVGIERSRNTEAMVESLNVLKRVGIGHLLLGQSGNTLSGGEAQRLKLATNIIKTPVAERLVLSEAEVSRSNRGTTLYLFDEPSTGLHYFDILPLIEVFQSLVKNGDTVIFIEHNSTLIEAADQVITLGPGSGENGGLLIV